MSILKTLSVVSVIWIIAAGVLVFFLLFLFAKRQIMRFTLKSSGGPYVSIGSGAPKEMKREINRRLNRVPELKFEPKLLNPTMEQVAKSGPNHYYYRMKAMDSFAKFNDVMRQEVPTACRQATQTMRNYLASIYPVYLSTAPPELVDHFVDMYEHARHRPEVFEENHYNKYMELLDELILCLEHGLKQRKQANIEEMKKLPLLDTEVTLKSTHKGKTKSSIPYNAMTSEKYSGNYRGQTRYRTRANSSEQAGLLESAQSSQRSSVEVLNPHRDSSEKIQLVDMNTMPDI